MSILIPVLVLFGVALLCAVLLTLASTFFGVEEDQTVTSIRECLPGANCGACGYNGCDGYAQALANKSTDATNLCIPGGDATAAGIAQILGLEALDVVEKVAYVACNGTCNVVATKFDYRGPKTCRAVELFYSGDKACTYACHGYGDCVRACPQNAISIHDGVACVDPALCIGCGICVRECPNHIIKLIDDTSKVVVECSNHDKGAVTRKNCTNGCIGCMKCEKTCPHGAIKVDQNLATIDYLLCTGCAKCVEVCPVHCLHTGDFTGGTHQ